MFDKEYVFSGKHADMVKKLTAQFGTDTNSKIFSRNIDVYIVAPIIGFLYGRKSSIDNTSDQTTKIFTEQLIKETTTLKYNYQLIMLLNKKQLPFEERLDKAFRNYGNKENTDDEETYNEFVLGGVEILYEKIIEGANMSEDFLQNIYDFTEEFNNRYNGSITTDEILDLCMLAKK